MARFGRRGGIRSALGGLAALLLIAASAAALAPRAGRYAGATDQGYPDGSHGTVAIEMTRGGRRIKHFEITWLAACDNGFTALAQGTRAVGSLSRRGGFRGRDTYFSDRGNLAGTPYTATISDRLRGRFVSRRRAKGSFRATAVIEDPGGRQVSSCATPPIRWSAKR
jgi:hypothetical protein